jgi:hypothetical protein
MHYQAKMARCAVYYSTKVCAYYGDFGSGAKEFIFTKFEARFLGHPLLGVASWRLPWHCQFGGHFIIFTDHPIGPVPHAQELNELDQDRNNQSNDDKLRCILFGGLEPASA